MELHGQHDDRGLLNPRGHRAILDEFGGSGTAARRRPRRLAGARRRAQKALAAGGGRAWLRSAPRRTSCATRSPSLMRWHPQPGEEAALDARSAVRCRAAERIRADVQRAHEVLGDQGAEGAMRDALRWLDGAADRAEGALDAPHGRAGARDGGAGRGAWRGSPRRSRRWPSTRWNWSAPRSGCSRSGRWRASTMWRRTNLAGFAEQSARETGGARRGRCRSRKAAAEPEGGAGGL